MALLTTQSVVQAGLAASYSAAAASDTAVPGDNVVLHVKNGGGSPDTVTLVTPGTVSGLAIADQTVSVAAGAEKFIPLLPDLYRDPSTGLVTIQHSFTTSVTVAAISV